MDIIKERVRAIIKNDDSFLLIHRIKKGTEYWVFPGGGVEDDDKDKVAALIRECKEELGVEIEVGNLFANYNLNKDGKNQSEYFYFCEIIGGVIGTGFGPEFQKEKEYNSVYIPEWVPFEQFLSKDIKPEEIKNKIIRKV